MEQFGFEMMPPCILPSLYSAIESALTSGMISGTPSVRRKAEELSTTKHPFLAAIGPNFLEIEPPAENSAMSISSKESGDVANG